MDVAQWLHALGLGQYAPAFRDNDIDGVTLRNLTKADLDDLGVRSVGHRRRLVVAIATLSPEPAPQVLPDVSAREEAERRQLTVLYCEMAGRVAERAFTQDFEAQRALARHFHKVCVGVAAEHDGHVANFYGDRILVYFGWPRAHEDDVQRAVLSGLAMVQRIGAIEGEPGARAAISTGHVVVGDLVREGPAQQQSAVGLTPNLAARLLALAEPGQLVVDALTRQVVAPGFVLRSLGSHVLKGISNPVEAFVIGGERQLGTRFEAHRGDDVAPMVGRDQELALLRQRWTLARESEGAAVLLTGEAGIGKSRIAHALLHECAQQLCWQVHWQCSPYHAGSALWPVIQHMERGAGAQPEAPTVEASLDGDETAALYANLLGTQGSRSYGPLEMAPQMLRERTLEVLAEQLFELADERPLLLVVEDAHWVDATTLELINRCLVKLEQAKALILVTSRPQNQPALAAHASVTSLSLSRLNRASVETIVARMAGANLQPETLARIVSQTDGVPLFVEELTKAVMETGETAIPASLHGSLMARLDRIPEVKEVAQIAACIGREFSQALLQAVAERPQAVGPAIDRLVAAELVFRRGHHLDAQFAFKHALVQQAAYESLLRKRRRAVHLRILEQLERQSSQAQPDVLAYHAAQAGLVEKAVAYEGTAAELALANSAHVEAAHHLTSALAMIEANRSLADWRTRELTLRYRLGRAQISTLGFGSEVTRRTHETTYALLDLSKDTDLRVPVLYGAWLCRSLRGELADALPLTREMLHVAQIDGDAGSRLVAHRMAGATDLMTGRLDSACAHLEQALTLHEPQQHSDLARVLAIDPGLAASCYFAWATCLRGLPQQALAQMQHARGLAPAVPLLHANAYVRRHGALLSMLLGDRPSVRADALSLSELAQTARVRMWRGYADACLAWCELEEGRVEAAIEGFERGIEALSVTGARLVAPFFEACFARALGAAGREEEARCVLEDALASCRRSMLSWCEAELWRVRGELPGAQSPGDDFARGLALARQQGARLWEQRCAASLAQLWSAQGRHDEASALLSEAANGERIQSERGR